MCNRCGGIQKVQLQLFENFAVLQHHVQLPCLCVHKSLHFALLQLAVVGSKQVHKTNALRFMTPAESVHLQPQFSQGGCNQPEWSAITCKP